MKIKVHDRWFHKKPKVKKIKILQINLDYLHFNNENYAYFLDDKGIAIIQNKINQLVKTVNQLSEVLNKQSKK